MNRRDFVIPAIITGDLIGLLFCSCMLTSLEEWTAWLLYMLVFDLTVYLVMREKSIIRPGPMRQSWLIAIQRRARQTDWQIGKILLVEIAFAWAGRQVGLNISAWVLLMALVNLLVFYWHHTRMIQPSLPRNLQQEAFEEAAIRMARLRERRRYSL